MTKPYPECATCALRDAPLVKTWPGKDKARTLFVGLAPGAEEVKVRRPFAGRSGRELETAIGCAAGRTVPLANFGLTNAVLCHPAGKETGDELVRIRLRAGKLGQVDPVKACRRRLLEEVERYANVVLLGAVAVEAALAHKAEIMNLRGFPLERARPGKRAPLKVFPTVHPAMVLRATRWRHVFRSDVEKAFRFFHNQLRWSDPKMVFKPSPSTVLRFCAAVERAGRVYLDVETDGLESLTAHLRCLGMSIDGRTVIVVPFRLINGVEIVQPWKVRRAIRRILTSPDVEVIGHNAGYYDRTVLEQHGLA